MKKIIRICIILVCCAVFCNPFSVSAAPETHNGAVINQSGCNNLDATVPYLGTDRLVENVATAFLYEKKSDTLMYAWNPDTQIYPSSLVKVITAFYAIKEGNLEDVVTVTEDSLANLPYDAMSADLKPGEKLTLKDLIYCMMVGSANDAAAVIATHISGSEEAFVEQLNLFAKELGCSSTTLINPHGLHDPQQVSTVRDLSRIVDAATDNETFLTFFGATEYIVPATNLSEARNYNSTNLIMDVDNNNYDARVSGGRTGIAEDGTRCLATVAKADELELICIVTGAQSTFAENGNTQIFGGFKETTALYDLVFGKYKSVQVLYKGQAISQRSVESGECDVVLGSETAVSAILPDGVTQADLTMRYNDYYESLEAPVESGMVVSRLEIWYGNMCVAETDIVTMNPVRTSEQMAGNLVIEQRKSNAFATVVVIVLCVSAAVALVWIAVIMYGRWMRNKKKAAKKSGRRDIRGER